MHHTNLCMQRTHARTHPPQSAAATPHPSSVISHQSSSPLSRTPLPSHQNVPNVLTFARLVAVPILVAIWFSPMRTSAMWCAALFVAASFTDWLDGYIARQVRGAAKDPMDE